MQVAVAFVLMSSCLWRQVVGAPPRAGSLEVSSGSYQLPNGFLCGARSGGKAACNIWFPTDLEKGPFPIASFGHGTGGQMMRNLIESIASLGFVVVAPATGNCNDHGKDILAAMEDSRTNASLHEALGHVDFTRRAVFGHSFGGAHATGAGADAGPEHNIKAVVASHGASDNGAARLTLPFMVTSEVTPRGRRHRRAFDAAGQARPKIFAVAEGARHMEPLGPGRLNPFMAHFLGCHVADLQTSCDKVYGNAADSLCRAQSMTACEVIGSPGGQTPPATAITNPTTSTLVTTSSGPPTTTAALVTEQITNPTTTTVATTSASPVAATTTLVTEQSDKVSSVTSTTTFNSPVRVSGTIQMESTNAEEFVSDPSVLDAVTQSIAKFSGVPDDQVIVTFSQTRRLRKDLGRRLQTGIIDASYVITVPQGANAANIVNALNGTTLEALTTTISEALEEVVGSGAFSITVSSKSDPVITTDETTTTASLQSENLDIKMIIMGSIACFFACSCVCICIVMFTTCCGKAEK